MTPRLIPFLPFRHLVSALMGGAGALVAWGMALVALDAWRHARYSAGSEVAVTAEGAWWLAAVAAGAAGTALAVEGRFERTPPGRRALTVLVGAALAAVCTALPAWLWASFAVEVSAGMALRERLFSWMAAGGGAAFSLLVLREGAQALHDLQVRWELSMIVPPPPREARRIVVVAEHLIAGFAAGLLAAAAWYGLSHAADDLFLAGAAGAWVIGAVCGGLTWGPAARLYVGWLAVRVGARPGWRVPLDASQIALSERFVGHFPAGMDLYLPPEDGVAELHLSALATGDGTWGARGLTQQPVTLMRTLERVDLTFDPTLPAPLETPIRDGDRIRLGDHAEVEFLVLSREGAP